MEVKNIIKNSPAVVISIIFGGIIGFFIAKNSLSSLDKLRTPSINFVGKDEDVAFANSLGLANFSGAWVVVSGGEILNAVNSVSVDCWLNNRICNVAQADIIKSKDILNGVFSNRISYYDIIDWTESGQITAISSSLCEDQILKADIKTKVVTITEARKDNANKEMCPQGREPVVLKLGSKGY